MRSPLSPAGRRLATLEPGQISTNQFIWLLISVITSYAIAFVPSMLLRVTKPDGWIAVTLAWTADLLLAVVFAHMGLRFPGQTMVRYATTVLGPWLGKPVGFMFPLFFWFVSALLLRWVSEMLIILFLPGTPSVVVAAAILVVAAYGARAGLETVARAAELTAPIFIAVVAILLLLVTPHMDFAYLPPTLEEGIMPPLRGVPLALSFLAICIIMGMFQAFQNEPHRALFAKFTALTTGSLVIIGILLASVTLLGPEVAAGSLYPDLAIVRVIAIGEFFERIEVLWMATAVAAAVLSLAILLWAVALGVAETFGFREYKPLVFPLAGLILPTTLLIFKGQVGELVFTRTVFPLYALTVEAGLELLIWLVAVARGIRGDGQSPRRVKEREAPRP